MYQQGYKVISYIIILNLKINKNKKLVTFDSLNSLDKRNKDDLAL